MNLAYSVQHGRTPEGSIRFILATKGPGASDLVQWTIPAHHESSIYVTTSIALNTVVTEKIAPRTMNSSSMFLTGVLLVILCACNVQGFTSFQRQHVKMYSSTTTTTKRNTALNIFTRKTKNGSQASNLPKPDPSNPERFLPRSSGVTSKDFYPEYVSLLRNGPLPLITRLTNPDKYEQAIYKYQYDTKEIDLEEAQANMDAFFSSPDVWAEQKLREQMGERAVNKYSKPLDPERVVLSVVWGSLVLLAVGKIIWKGVLHF